MGHEATMIYQVSFERDVFLADHLCVGFLNSHRNCLLKRLRRQRITCARSLAAEHASPLYEIQCFFWEQLDVSMHFFFALCVRWKAGWRGVAHTHEMTPVCGYDESSADRRVPETVADCLAKSKEIYRYKDMLDENL